MNKLKGLYRNHKEEQEAEFQNYLTGGDTLKEFQDF